MELKITDLSKKFGDFTAVDNLNVTMTMGGIWVVRCKWSG